MKVKRKIHNELFPKRKANILMDVFYEFNNKILKINFKLSLLGKIFYLIIIPFLFIISIIMNGLPETWVNLKDAMQTIFKNKDVSNDTVMSKDKIIKIKEKLNV